MNYRGALRVSTDIGLLIFFMTIVGAVLWTTDEMLGWNLLPDQFDQYAKLLVVILLMLAALAVVISIMCSFTVMAESAAELAGIAAPTSSRRVGLISLVGILVAFSIMFGLHEVNQHRAAKRADELEKQIPAILPIFSPEMKAFLTGKPSQDTDEAIARLLHAVQASTLFNPRVSVMVPADFPYTYCVITALPEPHRETLKDDWEYLKRQYLIAIPSDWERETIKAGFEGKEMNVPRGRTGVFIDTRVPSAWGTIMGDDRVIGIVMLRASI